MSERPLLVGEFNPKTTEPGFELYPIPATAAGGRLAKILGLSTAEYLLAFERTNLCVGRWGWRDACRRAGWILRDKSASGRLVVALGARVASAFGIDGERQQFFTVDQETGVALLPHPSGLCRVWNDPAATARAREFMGEIGAL